MTIFEKRKFDIHYLNQIMVRDKAILLGEYKKITRNIFIDFKCNCGKENTKNFRIMVDYSGAFCKECTEKIKRKNHEETILKIYGSRYIFQVNEIREKVKQTCIKNYNVENPSQSETVKERKVKTCMKNYGVAIPLKNKTIYEKVKQTNLKIRGVEHTLQCPKVKEKVKQTNLRIRGVENPSQCVFVQKKKEESKLTFKEYVCPSGKVIKIQGYEYIALNDLFRTFSEDQIVTDRSEIPVIHYVYEDNKHYYFPDIFIPHLNKIIEVKSTWTYSLDVDKIKAKEKSTKEQGYDYEYWICDSNRVLFITKDHIF